VPLWLVGIRVVQIHFLLVLAGKRKGGREGGRREGGRKGGREGGRKGGREISSCSGNP
jgi:hypothetical protein